MGGLQSVHAWEIELSAPFHEAVLLSGCRCCHLMGRTITAVVSDRTGVGQT
jgi:hypothetical protein